MRICLPTGIFPPDIGGPASYVPRIAKALVERGHTVEVITLSDTPHDDGPYPFVGQRIPRGMARVPRMARTIARIAQAARRAEVVFANGLFVEAVLACGLVRRPLVAEGGGGGAGGVPRGARHVLGRSRYLAGIVCGWGVARARVAVIYNAPDLAPA